MTSFYRGPTETQSYDRSLPQRAWAMEAVPSGASFSSMQMVEALVDSSKKRSIMVYQIHHIHRTLPMLGTSPGDTCGFPPLKQAHIGQSGLHGSGCQFTGFGWTTGFTGPGDGHDNWNPDP